MSKSDFNLSCILCFRFCQKHFNLAFDDGLYAKRYDYLESISGGRSPTEKKECDYSPIWEVQGIESPYSGITSISTDITDCSQVTTESKVSSKGSDKLSSGGSSKASSGGSNKLSSGGSSKVPTKGSNKMSNMGFTKMPSIGGPSKLDLPMVHKNRRHERIYERYPVAVSSMGAQGVGLLSAQDENSNNCGPAPSGGNQTTHSGSPRFDDSVYYRMNTESKFGGDKA